MSKILCLASGGGQQGPVLAAAGADVTVHDLSDGQLATDREVADREGLKLHTEQGDMCDLSRYGDGVFDMLINPISLQYVPDVRIVWREAARVLKKGGRLLSGFTNPVVYMFDGAELAQNRLKVRYKLPFAPFCPETAQVTELYVKYGQPLEYGHSLCDLIGGQTGAGFAVKGFYEDRNKPDSGCVLDEYTDNYIATFSTKE